jgi:hypothetical protein
MEVVAGFVPAIAAEPPMNRKPVINNPSAIATHMLRAVMRDTCVCARYRIE